ncbi:MAG: hypothetical protein ABIA75_12135 [Candidatus Neomarinimicrobiota bacterium]
MKSTGRGSNALALILITIGILFLVMNFLPEAVFHDAWWLIFILLAAGFYLPALVWPKARRELAALLIPGTILAVLGLIFMYCTSSGNWEDWDFLWTLIPGSVGLGLYLSARVGRWDDGAARVGLWLLALSLTAFLFFAGRLVKTVGAVVLILIGLRMLTDRKKNEPEPSGDEPEAVE